MLSVEHADRLAPGGAVRSVLGLAALLDGHGIPGAVFTSSAVCEYLARGSATDPERAWIALVHLERAGLLAIDAADHAADSPGQLSGAGRDPGGDA